MPSDKSLKMKDLAVKQIILAREAKGLTQAEVAQKLAAALKQGYSLRQYQKMETGDFPKYKKEVIQQLEKILGVKLYELIYELNVPREKEADLVEIDRDLNKVLRDHQEDIIQIKATVNILRLTVADLAAQARGKPIVTVSGELTAAIDAEVDRLFAELKRKHG